MTVDQPHRFAALGPDPVRTISREERKAKLNRGDLPAILDLYAAGRLEIDALISATYPLEAVADACADLEDGRVLKAVIEFPVT